MIFEYKITREQVVDCLLYCGSFHDTYDKIISTAKWNKSILLLSLAITMWLLSNTFLSSKVPKIVPFVISVILIFLAITNLFTTKKLLNRKNKKLLNDIAKEGHIPSEEYIQIKLNRDAITVNKDYSSYVRLLSLIYEFKKTDDCYYILFKGNEYLVVPYSAFISENERRYFEKEISKNIFLNN